MISYTQPSNKTCFDVRPMPSSRKKNPHLTRYHERGKEEKVDRRRGGKTTSKSGQGWSVTSSQRAVENRIKMERAGCKVVSDAPTIPTGCGESEVK